MPPLSVNFNEWPIWLMAILLFVNLFRNQIGALLGSALPATLREQLKNAARMRAEQMEHDQQSRSYDQMRRSWREDNLMDILKEKDEWERETLSKQIADLTCAISQNTAQMQEMSRAIMRWNDVLVNLSVMINQMSEILRMNGQSENGAAG